MSILECQDKRVSKQALDKRFNENAVVFLQRLFEWYLTNQISSRAIPSWFTSYFSSIRIMDSTEFKLPACMAPDFPGFQGDGTESCAQLQFEYNIISGKINDLSIVDARTPDCAYAATRISTIGPKDLIIRDLGYSSLDSFEEIGNRGAYFISRLHQQILIYTENNGELVPLSYDALLKKLKKSRLDYLDIPVFIGRTAKVPVRLIANLLKRNDITRRLSKKIFRKNAGDKKYDTLSQINVFITNVPEKILSSNQVYDLYRIRWQIELVFKAWKSVLKINKVRKMKSDRFKCYLLGKLLWVLLSWEICFLFREPVRQCTNKLLSLHKCFKIIKIKAPSLRSSLASKMRLRQWLLDLYDKLKIYGLKESKKGGKSVAKLLNVKPITA